MVASALHCYCVESAWNTDFFQNSGFKESINMAVKITSEKRWTFMKSNVFHFSHGIKNIHRSKFYQWYTHWRKRFLKLLLWKVYGSFLLRQTEKTCDTLWFVWVFFAFLGVRRLHKYCLWQAYLVYYMYIFDLMWSSANLSWKAAV